MDNEDKLRRTAGNRPQWRASPPAPAAQPPRERPAGQARRRLTRGGPTAFSDTEGLTPFDTAPRVADAVLARTGATGSEPVARR